MTRRFSQLLSAALSAALLLLSPGLQGYAAAAGVARNGAVSAGRAIGAPAALGTGLGADSTLTSPPLLDSLALQPGAALALPADGIEPALSASPDAAQALAPQAALAPAAAPADATAAVPAVSRAFGGAAVALDAAEDLSAPAASSSRAEETLRAMGRAMAHGADSRALFRRTYDQAGEVPAFESAVALGRADGRAAAGALLSKNGASGAPDAAPGGGSVQPPAGGKGGSAGGEARGPIDPLKAQSYTWVLLLTIGGAAAAYFGIPRLVPDYQTYLPKLVVETPYAVKAGIAAAGGLIGVTLSQRGTWSGFVFKLFGGAASAAVTTFRGWARFGLLFNAGVTGGSPKEAENAPISAAFWRYPILAWPAVLTGYGFGPLFLAAGFLALGFSPLSWTFLALSLVAGGAPVAFVAGFLYKAVSTPVMALARGVKQLVVGFFPWLGDVLEAAREILANIVPFTVGFVTGGFKAWWNATAAGSAVFARPFYDLLIQKARPETLPGWIGIAVAKVLTAVAMIPAALLGGLLGTLASVLYSPTRALSDGMRATESQIRFAKVMVAWFDGLELERGIDAWIAGGANGRPETIDARSGLIAFAHVFAQTAYQIPAAAAYGLAAYFRAWGRARYFLKNGKFPERAPQAAAPAADAPAAAAVPSKPAAGYGFFPDLAIAGAGAWLGYSALGFFGGPAGWLALALAAAGGAFAALSFTQPSTWRDWLPSTRRAARDSALESFRSWAGLGLGSAAALVDGPVDLALKKASPAWIGRYPALAWPAVLIGYPLAAAAFVAGGVFQFALVPFKAAWLGLESLARETGRFFKKALPFAVGFIGGALMGWGAAIVGGATILGKPLFEQVVTPSEKYDESSWIGFIGSWAVRIAAAVAGVAAGALGAAAGLVLGLPVVLSTALHRGNRAAGNEGRFARALRIWAYETFNAEFLPLEKLAEPGFPEQGKPISAWDGLLRLGNTAGAAAMAVLALPLVVLAAHLRSSRDAWRYAGARDAKVSIIELVDGLNDRLNAMPGSTKAYGPYNYTGARASESLSDKHDLPLFFEERGRTGYIRLAFNTEADLAAARQAGIVEDVIGGYPVEVVVLESATPADEAAPAAKEAAPAPAPPAQPSVRYVAGLGLLGLALGIVGVIGTLPFLGPLGFWTAAGFYAAAGSAGTFVGLGAAQRARMKALPSAAWARAARSGGAAFGYWRRLGLAYRGALRGETVNGVVLYGAGHAVVGAISAVFWGGVALLASGFRQFAASSWASVVQLAKAFWEDVVPFLVGFVKSLFAGFGVSIVEGAVLFGRPYLEQVLLGYDSQDRYKDAGKLGGAATFAVQAVGFVAMILAGAVGAALGLVYGLPAALTAALAGGYRGAESKSPRGRALRVWLEETAPREFKVLGFLSRADFRGQGRELRARDGLVRLLNVFLGGLVNALTAPFAVVATLARSLKASSRYAKARTLDEDAISAKLHEDPAVDSVYFPDGLLEIVYKTPEDLAAALAEKRASPEMYGYPTRLRAHGAMSAEDEADYAEDRAEPPLQSDPAQAAVIDALLGGKIPGTRLVAAAGGVGVVLGAAAGYGALALLGGPGLWLLIGALAAGSLAGASIGLTAVQTGRLGTFVPAIRARGGRAAGIAWSYWDASGRAFERALDGRRAKALGWRAFPYAIVGGASAGLLAFLAGAAAGIGVLRDAFTASVDQLVDAFMPWLRWAWDTIKTIAKKILPFLGGLVGGAFSAVVGSALFGALLLGRPFFKHVVAPTYDRTSIGRRANVLGLRAVAVILGAVFGLAGLVAGLVAAAPYVVTLPFAAAFQYAEIGGPGQRFFEHWTKNHLRTELQNLRQMTDSYEFQEERPGGRLEAGDGWLRLLNVASRSLLAPLATAIVGWVAFFRSLYKAGRDTRAGKPAPRAVPYDDIGPMLGEWVKLSVRYGWMGGLAAGAVPPVVLAVGYAYGWPWAVSALTWALGLLGIDGLYKGSIESTGLYGTLAGAAVGLAAGLVVSVVFGVGAALVEWLAAQIEKDPPQAADRKDGSR